MNKIYCESLTEYKRFYTRVVPVGDLLIGGNNPIVIQSMTNTDTKDTKASVNQILKMVDSGCQLVRLTTPSLKDALNLKEIKSKLKESNCNVPLVADIHFTPSVAEEAARIVEKVRVNPGNYIDRKQFKKIEYTDNEYQNEVEKIYEQFSPLVKICKAYGTAMRIGTNHGSLSDRIMSRYGDTPLGMVESALEFAEICEDLNYKNIVFSMKASNTQVMVQAYRLLTQKMFERKINYPLHIGVTEAGDGEDARIKSAVGIGTLLEDGIGDTIRVSLTEPPELEAPVAISFAQRYSTRNNHNKIKPIEKISYNPYSYKRNKTYELLNIGGKNPPVVIADFTEKKKIDYEELSDIGYSYNIKTNVWETETSAADYLYIPKTPVNIEFPPNLKIISNFSVWKKSDKKTNHYPIFKLNEFIGSKEISEIINFVELTDEEFLTNKLLKLNKNNGKIVYVISTFNANSVAAIRRAFIELQNSGTYIPVIVKIDYQNLSKEEFQLYAATDFGALLTDGFGDGVWTRGNFTTKFIIKTLFGILQATRVRISKPEYISCPSCGRTLFDLVEVTAKIRKRTKHLVGIKIGIMGCIVNGPGEMADADYGYVGAGAGKISLYKGMEVVKKGVKSEDAVEKLIDLIKEDGRWIEPKDEN